MPLKLPASHAELLGRSEPHTEESIAVPSFVTKMSALGSTVRSLMDLSTSLEIGLFNGRLSEREWPGTLTSWGLVPTLGFITSVVSYQRSNICTWVNDESSNERAVAMNSYLLA